MRLQYPLEVVTPTVDGAVLQVLASADRHFTTTQVTNLSGRSPAGVRLVLNRLANKGSSTWSGWVTPSRIDSIVTTWRPGR